MNVIELLATLFSLSSVVASIKNSVLTWPLGIVGILFYMLHFNNLGLTANTFLQLIFIIQSLYGWYNWKSDIIISRLNKLQLIYTNLIFFILSFGMIFLLRDFVNNNLVILDSITTSLSLVGITLLAMKKIQSWYYWIIADILYIFLFLCNENYLSMITYLVFLLLAIIGLKKWKTKIK
jgi:nicotinamide mononucleotide transporter